jgi:hypothetical protein
VKTNHATLMIIPHDVRSGLSRFLQLTDSYSTAFCCRYPHSLHAVIDEIDLTCNGGVDGPQKFQMGSCSETSIRDRIAVSQISIHPGSFCVVNHHRRHCHCLRPHLKTLLGSKSQAACECFRAPGGEAVRCWC